MKARLLTAVIGIPFLIFVLVVRGIFAELLLVFFTMVALSECYKALKVKYNVCTWGGYFAALAMWPLSYFFDINDPLLLVAVAMGISMSGVILGKEPSFPNAAVSIYPLLTCLMPLSMFMVMLNRDFGLVPGIALITLTFGISFGSDGFAYIVGKACGKRKLCPSISPKKTVEGAIGAIGGSVFVALCVRAFFVHVLSTPMPGIPAAILLGVLGSYAGQIGDLVASLLKRYTGIKDYGKIFPGHGGVMDRFDSIIFVLIVMYCYTLVL